MEFVCYSEIILFRQVAGLPMAFKHASNMASSHLTMSGSGVWFPDEENPNFLLDWQPNIRSTSKVEIYVKQDKLHISQFAIAWLVGFYPTSQIIVSASCLDHEGTISKFQASPDQGSRWEHMMPLLASSLSVKRPCAMTHVPTIYVPVRLNRSDSFAMAYSAWYLYRWHLDLA